MKAYLAITGTIFGLMALMHILRAIDERHGFSTNPGEYIAMAVLGLIAAGLSIWGWRLFLRANRS